MRYTTSVVLIGMTAWLAGCGWNEPAPKAAPPAKVANPVSETQLATVTLTEAAERRLAVETVTATIEAVLRTRTVGGEVIAPAGKHVVVTAPLAGTPRGQAWTAGTRVSQGQTIFTIFPLQDLPPERDFSIEAQREMAAASAELKAAEARLTRLEQLLEEGATSARSVEDARAQRDVLAARVTAARARLSSLSAGTVGQRGEVAVRAPFAGVLMEVSAQPGQTVAAGAPLFSVSQIDTVWVRVPVYVGERSELDLTQPAVIRGLGATTGAGILAKRVDGPPSANPAAATADLYYAAMTGASLRIGERVQAELPLRASQKALVVPDAALLYDLQGGTWVYEAAGNHAYVRRRVEVGGQAGRKVIITRGLREGQTVVTAGAAEILGTEFGAGK